MYLPKSCRVQIDQIETARLKLVESARLELMEAAIKKGRWKEYKRSLFPVKPTERYLLVLGNYGQPGLTPQELYSVREIWLQAPDEAFNLSVKTVWANLHKLVQAGLAESVNEGLTYRYFAKQEKFLDFGFRWVLGSVRSKPQPSPV